MLQPVFLRGAFVGASFQWETIQFQASEAAFWPEPMIFRWLGSLYRVPTPGGAA